MAALRALAALMLPLGTLGAAHPAPQDPPTGEMQGIPPDAKTRSLMLGELDSRLTVKVAVGDAGPFNFIIDTGAERTVVSRELAGSLGLAPGVPVQLVSMSGTEQVNTVVVPGLAIEAIGKRHDILAPALERSDLGAQGLLGIDTLQDHVVRIDFDAGTMTVAASQKRRRAPRSDDEIVVTARSRFGQLIVTDAYFANSRVEVVIDTGAQVSMGNTAFRNLIGKRKLAVTPIELTSVTGGKLAADYALVPKMHVGGVRFDQLPVAFAEVAPFAKFGLTQKPALLLGMDALRGFRQVEIDFPNRQVRFRMQKRLSVPRFR
ncbi:aspartyl protease family protein [Sphingomonas canadensis]|uniref:Aspartyl protease family protein n=1 Tax=Sphingomonas canadensis TaxID=1219257 RepID=A0ABW3H2F1_9SPHN|nr:aspartyl protease family protein [Sphingomonas canadensis]MCW3834546.1 aspartyl protease family protein [Sphingomonas canadensis]